MASLLVIVFAVEVFVLLVNTFGTSAIENLLWTLYNSFPTPTSKAFAEQRKLQQEFLKVRRDLNGTSSQDEFARWAKLRRQHDKLLEQLEKKKSSLDATRGQFDRYAMAARLVSTRGLQFFLPMWYSREPMFWLPHGWFPYYAEWLLSFPRAPLGSVSIMMWQMACTGILVLVKDTIVGVYGLVISAQQQQQKEAPVKAPGGQQGSATTQTARSKKDS